jgi:hypothetical protein
LSRLLRWLIPNGGTLLIVAVLILTQSVWARPFAATNAPGPSATTVNYQGRLADNAGTPLDGNYGMAFALYDAATDGNLVWGPEEHTAVAVSDGLFSVGLGSKTSGGIPTNTWNGDRYLEITVGGETLEPRELIRSVPIAGMALTVPDGAMGTDQIADGAITADKIATNVTGRWTFLTEAVKTNWSGMGDQDWTDLTLEGIPATATAALVQLSVKDSAGNAYFWMRPDGCTHEGGAVEAFSPAPGIWNSGRGIVKLEADNVVEYRWNAAGSDTLRAIIKIWGYYEPVGR